MKREVEILIELKDDKITCLNVLGAYHQVSNAHTIDNYYYDPARTNLKPNNDGRLHACLRTRDKGGIYSLTYKNDVFNSDGSWLYSDEFETGISNLEAVQGIIMQLGLLPLVVIDSVKYVFETDCYEITLEDVAHLGLFLEVERKGQVEEKDVVTTKQAIRFFVQEELGLQIGKELDAGKPELMLRVHEQYEELHTLV